MASIFARSGSRSRFRSYDLRDGAPDGPLVGRIYKMVHSPSGTPWSWAVQLFPAVADDTGTGEMRGGDGGCAGRSISAVRAPNELEAQVNAIRPPTKSYCCGAGVLVPRIKL